MIVQRAVTLMRIIDDIATAHAGELTCQCRPSRTRRASQNGNGQRPIPPALQIGNGDTIGVADKKIAAVATIKELERSDHPWIRSYLLGPRGRAAKKEKES